MIWRLAIDVVGVLLRISTAQWLESNPLIESASLAHFNEVLAVAFDVALVAVWLDCVWSAFQLLLPSLKKTS